VDPAGDRPDGALLDPVVEVHAPVRASTTCSGDPGSGERRTLLIHQLQAAWRGYSPITWPEV